MAQQSRGRFRDLVARLFARDEIIEPIRLDGEPSFNPMSTYYRTRMELSSNRIKRYKDYRDMGEDTLISGALDMYADEAAQFDRQEGATVWVISNNKEVEKDIRRMLDATEMEEQIPGLARYLAQHGDNPVRPLADKNKGIVAMEFLEAEDFERQVDKYGRLTGFRIIPLGDRSFEPWDVVHFRIMNRTQTVRQGGSIYGTSVLENARKTWRQLSLLEDQLVIYRLEVGGRHRVFYIDVGTASHEQALAITRKYERQFGRKQYFNPQCLTADTKVFTLDGRQLRMDEMAAEVASGKQQWVYSYDLKKKKVVPGKVLWAGKTGTSARVCRVQLDNDTSVMCTLDHRFLVKRDGGKRHEYVEASNLQPGDSITPVNFKLSDKGKGDLLSGYRMVWQDRFDNYQYVHRAVAHAAIGTPRKSDGTFQPDYLVHHQDFNKLNNAPENLEWKTHQEHVDHHEKHSKNLELGRIRMQEILSGEERGEFLSKREATRQATLAANPELRSKLAEASAATLRAWNKSDKAKVQRKRSMASRWQDKPAEITDSLVRGKVNSVFAELRRRGLPVTEQAWDSVARQGQISWAKAKARYPELFNFNHKVVSVTMGGREDVYDITVEQHHNFAVALEDESGVFVHNSGEWTSRFTPLQLTSEIFWPIRGESNSRIEYLGTDPNVQGIADLDYFRNKLFASLKIPKAYIGGDEYSSARYGLAQVDIAFARSVQRLQRAVINGITRMGQIHLSFLGKDPTKAENQFQIMMSPPSTLDQEQRMEALDLSLTLSMKMKQIGEALGLDDQALNAYIQKTMLGLTPYDLSRITAQIPGQGGSQEYNQQVMDSLIRMVNGDPESGGYRGRGERGDNVFPALGDQDILNESLMGTYESEAGKGSGFEPFFGETTEDEVLKMRSKLRVSDKGKP